jgi:hypothetical protein
MHIVTTTDKKIYFVPRAFDLSVSVKITDEETNVSTTESLTATKEANYLHITPTYTFVEGRYYTIRITGTSEIYRGKVYCTNQADLEKFSINSGEFTYYEDTDNDNQYIYR